MYKGAKECQGFISHFCMVNFTNVTLAFKDANSKLLDVVSVADVDVKERVDDSLVEIVKVKSGRDFEPEHLSKYLIYITF